MVAMTAMGIHTTVHTVDHVVDHAGTEIVGRGGRALASRRPRRGGTVVEDSWWDDHRRPRCLSRPIVVETVVGDGCPDDRRRPRGSGFTTTGRSRALCRPSRRTLGCDLSITVSR
jgi:hypothetical protein